MFLTFKEINQEWLLHKMLLHDISKSQLAQDLGVRIEMPGRWLKGERMAITTKSMLYYYFQNLECRKKS
jgi:hypothetical protein